MSELTYERIGCLRAIALKKIAEGGGRPAEVLLALSNDIEALLRDRDEWKGRAEQWKRESIRLLHMVGGNKKTESVLP